MEQFFPIIVAVCVGLIGWTITLVIANLLKGEKRKLAQRLAATGGITQQSAAASITLQTDTSGMPDVVAKSAFLRALYKDLIHAYPDASFGRFCMICFFSGLGTLLIVSVLMTSWIMGSVAGAVALYLPVMFVNGKKSKRQRILAEQLPEALDFLQRILRAGHSLSTGLAMMAEELPQPLAGEFRRCYDQHSLGQSLDQAMKDMAKRIESTDFAFFVTAVLIQRSTGGDLSQVLGNISGMIRQRIRLQQYVKAKTAEGRFTGYILVAFPILMFFIAYTMNPDYGKVLLHTSTGLTLLGIAGGLVFLGLIAIRKITTVKV